MIEERGVGNDIPGMNRSGCPYLHFGWTARGRGDSRFARVVPFGHANPALLNSAGMLRLLARDSGAVPSGPSPLELGLSDDARSQRRDAGGVTGLASPFGAWQAPVALPFPDCRRRDLKFPGKPGEPDLANG